MQVDISYTLHFQCNPSFLIVTTAMPRGTQTCNVSKLSATNGEVATATQVSKKKRPLTRTIHQFYTTTQENNEVCCKYFMCSNLIETTAQLLPYVHTRKDTVLYWIRTLKQTRICSHGSLTSYWTAPQVEQQELVLKQLCKWIVSSSLPFSPVEGPEFEKLLHIFNIQFFPSRVTISRGL